MATSIGFSVILGLEEEEEAINGVLVRGIDFSDLFLEKGVRDVKENGRFGVENEEIVMEKGRKGDGMLDFRKGFIFEIERVKVWNGCFWIKVGKFKRWVCDLKEEIG